MEEAVRACIQRSTGGKGDEAITDYVVSVVTDDDFEWGEDGEDAFEAVGEMLVDGGCVADEAAARELCAALQQVVLGGGASVGGGVSAGGSTHGSAALGGTASARGSTGSFRALAGGPVLMDDIMKVELHPSEVKSGKHLIQNFIREGEEDDSFSLMTARDQAKLKKLQEKQEKQQRAAFEAHQEEAKKALAGERVVVVRNAGGPTVRDIHLHNFSVSNGGQELIVIEDGVTLAYGRRRAQGVGWQAWGVYGLVGRNGTGKTTLLRHLAAKEIRGIPASCQILHVEQEVVGGDVSVLQTVLSCDTEREELLEEERRLLQQVGAGPASTSGGDAPSAANGAATAAAAATKGGGRQLEQQQQQAEAAAAAAAGGGGDAASLEVARRLEAVSKRLHEIDAYGAEARAAAILAGLSFDKAMQARPTKTFSGGWRMRVALARALFVEPDILLLDEPTNHLDLHAVLWLQDYLLKWPKTLIVVSHAREFLNEVCTDIVHLHSRTLTAYRGNFDNFEKTQAERMRNAKAAAESQDMRRKHMQASSSFAFCVGCWTALAGTRTGGFDRLSRGLPSPPSPHAFIDKFRYNAKRASLVQSRIKALERLADVALVEDDPSYLFCFPTPPDAVSPPILSFTDVAFGYPGGPTLFHNLNFGREKKGEGGIARGRREAGRRVAALRLPQLDLESRFAIVGPNGIGKSTLLGLISGALQPTQGHVYRNPKVRLATFSQHHVDGLDLALTPLQYLAKTFPSAKEPEFRSHLSSFGVGQELASQAMYTLSGGQKSRVALSKITWSKPHLLLLDEPSNHLDLAAVGGLPGWLELVDALIEGLALFKGELWGGAEHLIESTVDELWAVEGGTVHAFHGSFEDYKKRLRALSRA
eukprot:scaffold2.g6972.t1